MTMRALEKLWIVWELFSGLRFNHTQQVTAGPFKPVSTRRSQTFILRGSGEGLNYMKHGRAFLQIESLFDDPGLFYRRSGTAVQRYRWPAWGCPPVFEWI